MTLTADDLAKVKGEVVAGTAELWRQAHDRDTPTGRQTGNRIAALTVTPVIQALAADDNVDETLLATALAPLVAAAVIAALPEDRDDVSVDELVEAFRRAVAGPDPDPEEEPPPA
jgi:hypothetical protein